MKRALDSRCGENLGAPKDVFGKATHGDENVDLAPNITKVSNCAMAKRRELGYQLVMSDGKQQDTLPTSQPGGGRGLNNLVSREPSSPPHPPAPYPPPHLVLLPCSGPTLTCANTVMARRAPDCTRTSRSPVSTTTRYHMKRANPPLRRD